MAQGNAKKIGLDHGDLVGKDDDDHTQYLNESRHQNEHPSFRAERATSNQVIGAGTTTAIYNSIIYEDDADGDFSYNTSTGELTINTAGVYMFTAGIRWENNTTGVSRRSEIKVNGSEFVCGFNDDPHANFWKSMSGLYKCSVNDVITVEITQDSGGDLDLIAHGLTFFGAMRVS